MSDNVDIADQLRIGCDLGTDFSSVSGQHTKGSFNVILNNPEIRMVVLKPRQAIDMMQTAIWHPDRTITYGRQDVKTAITLDPSLQNKVIELYKLTLDPEFQHLEEVQHTLEVLEADEDDSAIQDFWTKYLRCYFDDSRAYYQRTSHDHRGDAEYWKSIALVPTFSVPSMWSDKARGVLRCAAKAAGAAIVELRDEALCVASAYIHVLLQRGDIEEGDSVTIADCGKGTFDIATVKLIRKPSAGQPMVLQRIGLTDGSAAGAHMFNTLANTWVRTCRDVMAHGSFARCCRLLNIPEREFFRQFSLKMDYLKAEFDDTVPFTSVVISGNAGGKIQQLPINIPREDAISFFDGWIYPAVELMRSHLRPRRSAGIKWVIPTGGGSKSQIFRDRITEAVQGEFGIPVHEEFDCPNPCARGALLQHVFTPDKLPDNLFTFLSRREEYCAALHPHAARSECITESSDEPGVFEVSNRLVTILRYSEGRTNSSAQLEEFFAARTIPMRFAVQDKPGRSPSLEFELYLSESPCKDHSALFNQKGDMRDGIREYPVMFVKLPDLRKAGFRRLQGEDFLRVKTYVDMYGDRNGLHLGVTVMKPHYDYPPFGMCSPNSAYPLSHLLTSYRRRLVHSRPPQRLAPRPAYNVQTRPGPRRTRLGRNLVPNIEPFRQHQHRNRWCSLARQTRSRPASGGITQERQGGPKTGSVQAC